MSQGGGGVPQQRPSSGGDLDGPQDKGGAVSFCAAAGRLGRENVRESKCSLIVSDYSSTFFFFFRMDFDREWCVLDHTSAWRNGL